jgi:CheY-like chemotaxis protein/HPt (histidine-containing phosphotransfer) domain-containing protein
MIQLLLETEVTPEQRSYAEVAQTSGQVLLALINDILDLSKIEAGKIVLENGPFNLQSMVGNVIRLFGVQASSKGLQIQSHVSAPMPCVRGDVHRLRQVLNNLIANAIKFTASGEVVVEVKVVEEDAGKATIHFAVTDTGIGIRPEHAATLFTPFTQADASTTRKYGGTGLGLAICKQTVGMMGGNLGLESQEGEGSKFYFTLVFETVDPLEVLECIHISHCAGQCEAARLNCGSDHYVRALTGVAPVGSEARILIVEDNATNQAVALAQLGRLGYQADVVANGAEAVEAVNSGKYHLVLMDCEMPVMDGFEATKRIRESGNLQIPIIAATAHAMSGDQYKCIHAGMNDFISKPVELQRLAEVLAKWWPGADRFVSIQAEKPLTKPLVAIFDEGDLLRRLMDDKELAVIIVQGFLEDFPAQLANLAKEVGTANEHGIRLHAHTLKGSAATVSALRLSAVARQMEKAASEGKADGLEDVLAEVIEEFDRYKRALADSGWL